MGVVDKVREVRWRAAGHHDRPLDAAFAAPLRDAEVLEVGGPSALFRDGGLLPVYPLARVVDGVQFSAQTIWHGPQEGKYVPDDRPTGMLRVTDGAVLDGVPDDAYDGIVSSHVIEHFANPLGALDAWRRVTRPGGWLLLCAPHMEGTFDHRRAVTPLAHMVEDHARGTGEDDLTHLDETLERHDRSRDAEPDDHEAWAALWRANLEHRVLHHHVFTTASLVELLVHARIAVEAVDVRHPHDIYVAGRFASSGSVDRTQLSGVLRRSPFRRDRAAAR